MKTLGEGGFGKVVLGIHKLTKEKFAIKIVNTGMIGFSTCYWENNLKYNELYRKCNGY